MVVAPRGLATIAATGKYYYVQSNGAPASVPFCAQWSCFSVSTRHNLNPFSICRYRRASLQCMYLATALTTADCIVCIGGKRKKKLRTRYHFSFVFLCFISICLCLYNACDNPTSLADTPPDRLSYGEISNHRKQITSAWRTWKIYVLGGGSCMTIRDFERRRGECCLCDTAQGFFPSPSLSFSA